MANDGPEVNGHKYDFSSVTVDVLGKLKGVKEIKYGNAKAGTKTRELGNAEATGRTRGELDCEGSMTMYRDAYDELIGRIGDGYMERSFNITVSYADTGRKTVSDKLIGCKITKDDLGASTGGDPLEVPIDLQPMRIFPNGKKPLLGMKE